MKESINEISSYWIEEFVKCINSSMNEGQFIIFTLFMDNVASFESVRKRNGFDQDLPVYIDLLRRNGSLGRLIKKYVLENDIVDDQHPQFKAFKLGIEANYTFDLVTNILVPEKIEELYDFEALLLRNKVFPFLDRKLFRDQLLSKLKLDQTSAKIIFVNGNPRSGMSYLKNYLLDICHTTNRFELVDIDISYDLNSEDELNGVNLAKAIADKLEFSYELEDERQDKFKFVRFVKKLSEVVHDKKKTQILFMHDFHKIPVLNDMYALLYSLLAQITNKLPNIILIIAGFQYKNLHNWHNEFKYLVKLCELESINNNDIEVVLENIYDEFEAKINALGDPISKDDYKESMMARLIPDSKIVIANIGEQLSDHLQLLNN